MTDNVRWRVGRTLGRTLYRDDKLVGLVDTTEIANEIVAEMNAAIPDECDDPDWDERTMNAPGRYGA